MTTFLLILLGLVALNFVLLKFSMQGVDTKRKNTRTNKVQINSIAEQKTDKSKNSEIPTAA
ncbi:hypothetical protein U6A24_22025 [Aquimarina gracilis]|uniref:Uncharacterized protein n=1 Tax=Aquimarina gracilis TaxID=874422 RepID=A0ABU6A259_9FLAO|nr:hypothetical protein [Aquimarina gracilis]MEB3348171.1 hypothetical protein [Aquimarina gracilis]